MNAIRVFILGAGGVGSECIRDLLQDKAVTAIKIADIDETKLASLASDFNEPRLAFQTLDVQNIERTANAIAGHDVLINSLYGELFGFVLEAACRAKVNYTDVYSHPTEAHARMAIDAGIVALTNLGSAPGISTVLGRKGCEFFDEPDEIHFSHVNWRLIAPTEAALDFAIDYAGRPDNPHTGFYVQGEFIPAGPFEGSKIVDFGEPIGARVVYFMPHSQAKTILKLFPQLKFAAVRGTWREQTMDELRFLRSNGLLDRNVRPVPGQQMTAWDLTRQEIWSARGGEKSIDVAVHALHVEVAGRKNGKRQHVTYRVRHHARDYAQFSDWATPVRRPNLWLTGVAASVGALMLTRSKSAFRGITTPEEFFEPASYLNELTKRPGIIIDELVDDVG